MKKETLKNHTMYTLELLFSQLKIYNMYFSYLRKKKLVSPASYTALYCLRDFMSE